jgi:Transglycosylase SLT domain
MPMADPSIAWGKKVSKAFKQKTLAIAGGLGCDPSHLMSAMAFESGESFSASVRNKQSNAVGLIQFMPTTAKALGTTSDALAAMTPEAQLDYVQKYLKPYKGRMKTLSDVYMTILWPKAVGQPEAAVLFAKPSKAYQQNAGLDANKDGTITKAEAAAKVNAKLVKGMGNQYRG